MDSKKTVLGVLGPRGNNEVPQDDSENRADDQNNFADNVENMPDGSDDQNYQRLALF